MATRRYKVPLHRSPVFIQPTDEPVAPDTILRTAELEVTPTPNGVEVLVPEIAVEAMRADSRNASIQGVIDNLIVEHAHDWYAQGLGNTLGSCTVAHDPRSCSIKLIYQYEGTNSLTGGTAALPTGWQFNYADTETRIVNATAGTADTTMLGADWATGNPADWTRIHLGDGWRRAWSRYTPELDPEAWVNENRGWMDPLAALGGPIPARPESIARLEVINKKAQELLLQHLNESQRVTWLASKFFDLMTPSGRVYRLKAGHYHNVFLLDQFGNEVREYCAYSKDPGGMLPVEDNLFAQMVTLRYNEQEFLTHANTWRLWPDRLFVGQGADAGKATFEDVHAAA